VKEEERWRKLWASAREWRGTGRALWCSSTMAGSHGGSALLHGRHAQARCHPLGHSVEQVSGDGLDRVERDFGLLAGRIRPWAKNEVCSTLDTLQL
jgi:hypothetical protein